MPDDQGNFVPGGFAMRGQGGELRHGHRVVTDLQSWTAQVQEVSPDERQVTLRLSVRRHDPDRFWFEHAPAEGLHLEIPLGRRQLGGAARILSRSPAFVIEATLEVL
jgi:hypothetical protein